MKQIAKDIVGHTTGVANSLFVVIQVIKKSFEWIMKFAQWRAAIEKMSLLKHVLTFLKVKVVKNVSQGSHFTMLEIMLHTDEAASVLQIHFLYLYKTFLHLFSVL